MHPSIAQTASFALATALVGCTVLIGCPAREAYTEPDPRYPQVPLPPPDPKGSNPLWPCSHDRACGTHRCNLATQRCAMPCLGDVDCSPGNGCHAGVCAPF